MAARAQNAQPQTRANRDNANANNHANTGCTGVRQGSLLGAALLSEAVLCPSVLSQSEMCIRDRDFGVKLVDGPLAGLLARSVVVVNPDGEVVYTELVPETTNEPNYEAALAAIK